MNIQIKIQLHSLIRQSDLTGLKNEVDNMQSNLLHFDDPSLLMIAIEVYLDPTCILNHEYQKDIIIFLIKAGLRLYSPKGEILLYLMNKCYIFDTNHPESEEDLEEKLTEVVDTLLSYNMTNILCSKLPTTTTYHNFHKYITKHQQAIKIQSWWRGYWTRKQIKVKLKPNLKLELKTDSIFTLDSHVTHVNHTNPFT